MIRLVRFPEVMKRRGKKRTSIYNDIKEGTFPPGVDLGGGRAKGWGDHEVDAVNSAILAGKSRDDLQELVRGLIAARKAGA